MKRNEVEKVIDQMVEDFTVEDVLRAVQASCQKREHENKDSGEKEMVEHFKQCRLAVTVCLSELP